MRSRSPVAASCARHEHAAKMTTVLLGMVWHLLATEGPGPQN
jgi:hypothetical protein